ncbi:MAG: ABC transporter substrate-binding protein [Propionicimonas sp.]|nr:ABC transporter substrate-binding protein [Propionicimonas sp.]
MDNGGIDSRVRVRRGRRVLSALLAGCLLVVLAACTPSGSATSPAELRTLSVGATLEPPSLDPFHNSAASIPQALLYNVYESLLKVDSEGKLRPLLAQAWEVSADRLTYNFHMNPAARFASGAPVDAAAVKAGFDRMQSDPQLTETLRAQLELVASVEAPDSAHVVITLTRPSQLWLYELSSTLGIVVDPGFTGDLADATAGSGPYTLKQHNRGQSIVLDRNPSYWGTPGRFDQVTFRYFSDPNAMNASMLSGDLDVISNLQAPDALPQFSDTSRFTTITGSTNGEVVLGLNNSSPALAKPEVRRALTMAIDRKALRDTVWNGQGTLIGSMVVPTDPWWEDLSNLTPYDPEGAKKLLADAGYGDGLTLRLRVPVVPYAVKSAQFVASQLRDIGVTATIEELEFSRWLPEVFTNGDYDLTIVAHVEARDIGVPAAVHRCRRGGRGRGRAVDEEGRPVPRRRRRRHLAVRAAQPGDHEVHDHRRRPERDLAEFRPHHDRQRVS